MSAAPVSVAPPTVIGRTECSSGVLRAHTCQENGSEAESSLRSSRSSLTWSCSNPAAFVGGHWSVFTCNMLAALLSFVSLVLWCCAARPSVWIATIATAIAAAAGIAEATSPREDLLAPRAQSHLLHPAGRKDLWLQRPCRGAVLVR